MSTEEHRAARAAVSAAIAAAIAAVLADYSAADHYAAYAEITRVNLGYDAEAFPVHAAVDAARVATTNARMLAAAASAYNAHGVRLTLYRRALDALTRAHGAEAEQHHKYLDAAIEGATKAARMRHAVVGYGPSQ